MIGFAENNFRQISTFNMLLPVCAKLRGGWRGMSDWVIVEAEPLHAGESKFHHPPTMWPKYLPAIVLFAPLHICNLT